MTRNKGSPALNLPDILEKATVVGTNGQEYWAVVDGERWPITRKDYRLVRVLMWATDEEGEEVDEEFVAYIVSHSTQE